MDPSGSGILARGTRVKDLERLKNGAVKPFVTPTFDGSKLAVGALMFDRDGNLWVGTVGKRTVSHPWKCGGALRPDEGLVRRFRVCSF